MDPGQLLFEDDWMRLGPSADRLLKSVRPLTTHPRGRPEAIGSCVLLKIGDTRFLATAAHVLELVESHSLLIHDDTNLTPVRGVPSLTPAPERGRAFDPLDVGIVRLASDFNLECDNSFLTPSDLDASSALPGTDRYLAIGFPLRQQVVSGGAVQISPFQFLAHKADPLVYSQLGREQNAHVIIEYDYQQVRSNQGIRTMGNVQGVSGGGLWWWRNYRDRYVLPDLRLVGILTDHRRPQHVMIATRIPWHLAAVVRVWPDVASYLVGFQLP